LCHNNDYETAPGADPHIHHPQDEIIHGFGGAGLTMASGMAGVECVDCHMWATPDVERGLPLSDVIGGEDHEAHWFEPTAEACADCHSNLLPTMPGEDKPTEDIDEGEANYTLWLQWEIFEEQWESEVEKWQKNIDSWQEDFETRWEEANTTLAAAYTDLVAANATEDTDPEALAKAWDLYYDALWNLHYVKADGSKGVHNFDYAMELLNSVEEDAEQIVELSAQKAAEIPVDGETDYTMYFYAVLALLVIIIILILVAIARRPKNQAPTALESGVSKETTPEPEVEKKEE